MRLSPLPADQWDDAARHAVSGMLPEERRNPRDAGNVLSTLVRHPKLTRAYLRFSSYLLYGSTLPPRIREQVILRVAHRRGCAYEWSHHVDIGKDVGLSDADIEAVQSGNPSDEFDRAVLGAVDELDEKTNILDQTWAALGERLDERQRMDLIFTIGGYIALAMALNTFGVEVEKDHGRPERSEQVDALLAVAGRALKALRGPRNATGPKRPCGKRSGTGTSGTSWRPSAG